MLDPGRSHIPPPGGRALRPISPMKRPPKDSATSSEAGRGRCRVPGCARRARRCTGARLAALAEPPPTALSSTRFFAMRMSAGPRMTMKSDGKMQPTSGNSILIGAFAAISSARWRRSIRSCSDWTCSTLLIATPSCSAWMTAPMKFVSAGTSVRGMMSRSASRRALPTRTSARARRNSSMRGPSIFSTTLPRAASKPRPARTEIVRRSRASGIWSTIACWRARIRRPSQNSGNDVADRGRPLRRPGRRDRCRRRGGGRQRGRRAIANTTALITFIPSHSGTRRSPGFPARARFFSVFDVNEVDVKRRRCRRGDRPAAARVRSKNGAWSSSSSRFFACIDPSWVRRAWTGSTEDRPARPTR